MRISATGEATPDVVWHRYVTPELWPTWAPQLRAVRCADTRVRAGSTGSAHGPALLRVPFEVVAVDETARRWSWRVGGPIGITMEHGVDDVLAGSRAWVDLPVFLLGYAPLAHVALRRLVRP